VSERGHEIVIRRILVALDASPHSQAALDAAALLAVRLRAELHGLFIEDADLLRLAASPFARQIGFYTGARRRLNVGDLERQLRARARSVREHMTAIAERDQLQWSFRVTRGTIAAELLAASSEADLVILGRSGWSHRRRRLGSTARAVVRSAPALTLLLQAGTCLGLPVLVVYDGSALAEKALVAGALLARSAEGPVTVVLVDGAAQRKDLRQRAAAQLRAQGVPGQYRALRRSNVERMAEWVRGEDCGTLVLPAKSDVLQDEALAALLEELEVPTLFVR
jgi:nucleotide-binding universal stress UspA family protein